MLRRVGAAVLAAALLAGCADTSPRLTYRSDRAETTSAASESPTPESSATAAEKSAEVEATFFDAPNQADTALAELEDAGRDEEAALIELIAEQPIATWLGEWSGDVEAPVGGITEAAAEADQIALFVVYGIPGRDCGLHSAGGTEVDEYLDWVQEIGDAIDAGATTWVILEPDALAQMGDCDGQGDRAALLAGAAEILDDAGAQVFLDAGHSNWRTVDDTAARIGEVGTAHLAGFATNTSNYNATKDEQAWADQVAELVDLPYVVDTSRNGNGSNGEWCNPRGRALGEAPGLTGDSSGMLARVWAKVPGESDGECNGGPAAGAWWEEIALELARDAV